MEAIKMEQIEIVLRMTEKEAKWLKGIMQNPISHQQSMDEEQEKDNIMRRRFWDVLANAGIQV